MGYQRRVHGKQSNGRKCVVPGRVVILKTLKSGLLLVTGPYRLNGVPLKRVNAAYCIPISSKLDVSKVDVSKVDDAFFADNQKVNVRSDAKKETQKKVDTSVMEVVNKQDKLFGAYLRTRFTLRNNMRFHEMSF